MAPPPYLLRDPAANILNHSGTLPGEEKLDNYK